MANGGAGAGWWLARSVVGAEKGEIEQNLAEGRGDVWQGHQSRSLFEVCGEEMQRNGCVLEGAKGCLLAVGLGLAIGLT
jgi:hypothetical protein